MEFGADVTTQPQVTAKRLASLHNTQRYERVVTLGRRIQANGSRLGRRPRHLSCGTMFETSAENTSKKDYSGEGPCRRGIFLDFSGLFPKIGIFP